MKNRWINSAIPDVKWSSVLASYCCFYELRYRPRLRSWQSHNQQFTIISCYERNPSRRISDQTQLSDSRLLTSETPATGRHFLVLHSSCFPPSGDWQSHVSFSHSGSFVSALISAAISMSASISESSEQRHFIAPHTVVQTASYGLREQQGRGRQLHICNHSGRHPGFFFWSMYPAALVLSWLR